MTNKKVLIAYATRYGTTEDTAKELAKILTELGIKPDLLNLKQVKEKIWASIDIYDGIIVGSGIKIGKWMKEPQKFLKKNKNKIESSQKVLALFVSCSSCLTDPVKAENDYLEKIIEKMEIRPVIYQAFGPILDFSETSQLGRIAKAVLKSVAEKEFEPAGIEIDYTARNDLRDKDQIRRFAEEFVKLTNK